MPTNDESLRPENTSQSIITLSIVQKLDSIKSKLTSVDLSAKQAQDLADRLDCLDATLFDEESLDGQVSKIVNELKLRQEEMKHVHDLSIMKVEKAAQKLLALESEIDQLKEELDIDEQDLLYLKVQLKALEVQAAPYIPLEDKEGLQRAFDNWKTDWANTDRRFRSRRSQRS